MPDAPDDIIRAIARQYLGVEILDVRNSDGLDFHSLSVSAIRRALEAAREAGRDEKAESPP